MASAVSHASAVDPGPIDPRRTIAVLFLLPDCDMRCRFCASERGFDTMSFARARTLLEVLRERGLRNVVLGGGEPALWPHDLGALARHAQELGFLVQLNTNGVRVPPGFPRVLGVDRTILSLEAADPALHDSLRPGPTSHHGVTQARIAALARAERELTISTVVTAHNVGAVRGVARHLHEWVRRGARIHAWHLYNFLPVGRGGRPHAEELAVPRERFLAACRTAKASGLPFPVYRRSHMLRSSTVEFFWLEDGELVVGSRRVAEALAG